MLLAERLTLENSSAQACFGIGPRANKELGLNVGKSIILLTPYDQPPVVQDTRRMGAVMILLGLKT